MLPVEILFMKFRILFTCDQLQYIPFYWFEIKGDDLYWGTLNKGLRLKPPTLSFLGNVGKINLVKDFRAFPEKAGKYSYHKSGQIHYKRSKNEDEIVYENVLKWPLKKDITYPIRFYVVITSVLNLYNNFTNNLIKSKYCSMAINLLPENLNQRLYFEFFLSPNGNFPKPTPMLELNPPLLNEFAFALNDRLNIFVNYGTLGNFSDWNPDLEISFLPSKIL